MNFLIDHVISDLTAVILRDDILDHRATTLRDYFEVRQVLCICYRFKQEKKSKYSRPIHRCGGVNHTGFLKIGLL